MATAHRLDPLAQTPETTFTGPTRSLTCFGEDGPPVGCEPHPPHPEEARRPRQAWERSAHMRLRESAWFALGLQRTAHSVPSSHSSVPHLSPEIMRCPQHVNSSSISGFCSSWRPAARVGQPPPLPGAPAGAAAVRPAVQEVRRAVRAVVRAVVRAAVRAVVRAAVRAAREKSSVPDPLPRAAPSLRTRPGSRSTWEPAK